MSRRQFLKKHKKMNGFSAVNIFELLTFPRLKHSLIDYMTLIHLVSCSVSFNMDRMFIQCLLPARVPLGGATGAVSPGPGPVGRWGSSYLPRTGHRALGCGPRGVQLSTSHRVLRQPGTALLLLIRTMHSCFAWTEAKRERAWSVTPLKSSKTVFIVWHS